MKKYSLYTLVLILLGIIVIITIFTLYFLINIQRNRVIAKEIETKISLAKTINEILYSPAWIYRLGMLPGLDVALLGEAAKFEDVIYLRIVSREGRIIQSVIREEYGKKIEDPEILALLSTKVPILRDEIFQGEKIKSIIYPGYGDRVIWVGFSLKGVEGAMREMAIYNILIVFGTLILVILIIFLVLKTSILNPLKKMIIVCQEVRKGNLEVKVPTISKTEIGELATTFNEMIKDLRESQEALEEAKTVLEIKVAARTRELEELAQSLEEKVKEKTKELQERVAELERFQRLTVGRELKMIELKEEIKKLKEELGKYKGRK